MVEVKADALEQSFEQFEDEDAVAALKAELETLKAKIASGVIAAQRPALDGVKSAEASSFAWGLGPNAAIHADSGTKWQAMDCRAADVPPEAMSSA